MRIKINRREMVADERAIDEYEEDEEELNAVVAALKAQYAQELPALIEELQQALLDASDNRTNLEVIDNAVNLAHRMHGTTGSYGLNELSDVMSDLEVLLKRIAKELPGTSDELWEALEKMSATVNETLEEEIAAL